MLPNACRPADVVTKAWGLLVRACDRFGAKTAPASNGSSSSSTGGSAGTRGSSAGGKKQSGKKQRQVAAAAGGSAQDASGLADAWAAHPGGSCAFQSVMMSWTRLMMWLRGFKDDSDLLPSGSCEFTIF